MVDTDFETSRITMLDCQIRPSGIDDHSILSAFASVAKENFVPSSYRSLAYCDETISFPTTPARYVLPPASLARLYQLASISPQDRVLDVGCGLGYSSAILSHLCSDVTALESDDSLVTDAARLLTSYRNVRVIHDDLRDGYESQSPYDVIFFGGSIEHLPDCFLSQLSVSGRIIVVFGTGNSGISQLRRLVSGEQVIESHFSCSLPLLPDFESVDEFVF